MNTHGGQRGLLHQLSPMCTFSVGIVAIAQTRQAEQAADYADRQKIMAEMQQKRAQAKGLRLKP
jgi:hypothetical protein